MSERLQKLRALMAEENIDCYVCFHGDSHNSEYLAPCDERIKFISGFSGSNGLCVVTESEARMWTDGRYYLAASKQLHEGWTMMKMEANQVSWFKWVEDNCKAEGSIGLDFTQYPAAMFDVRFDGIKKAGFNVKSTFNFVDKVWGAEKPERPCEPLKHLEPKYAGMPTHDKYNKIAEKLDKADCLLITALDQIAWLLNLRGNDIEFNPVFFSYAIFYKENKTC